MDDQFEDISVLSESFGSDSTGVMFETEISDSDSDENDHSRDGDNDVPDRRDNTDCQVFVYFIGLEVST